MVGPFGEVLVMDWGIAKVLAASADSSPAAEERKAGSAANTDGLVRVPQKRLTAPSSGRRDTWLRSKRAAKLRGSTSAQIFFRWVQS